MIALGCDHGGYELKQEIIKYLEENNLPFKDFGCYDNSSVDYPIYAVSYTHLDVYKRQSLYHFQ